MRMYDIIQKKKQAQKLSKEEIEFFVKGFTNGEIPDYQASALMMAVCLNSMDEEETAILTDVMANSGDMVDLSQFGDLTVDKHSTGGVGDKTTLVIAPIVAALGGKVSKMSGRGLGHTGGTVDKLESIDGYKTSLSIDEFLKQVEEIGIAVIGQTGNLAPADKKLYALRDVTATVDSIPLITSSIMSKKIAAGSKCIVLDVKVGSGAFMKTLNDAEKLAENMVKIGKLCGRRMSALITDMDTPLGNAVGNTLEIIEAVSVLKGENKGDLFEVCVALASQMISLVRNVDLSLAKQNVVDCINSGKALSKMKEWIKKQSGNVDCIENVSLFKKSKHVLEVIAEKDGYISKMNCEKIGDVSVILGAGRIKKDDIIDHSTGIIINKKTGDFVKKGETLCTLYTNNHDILTKASEEYLSALEFSNTQISRPPLIYKTVI